MRILQLSPLRIEILTVLLENPFGDIYTIIPAIIIIIIINRTLLLYYIGISIYNITALHGVSQYQYLIHIDSHVLI